MSLWPDDDEKTHARKDGFGNTCLSNKQYYCRADAKEYNVCDSTAVEDD
jgi:hypothetical protein